MVEDPLPDVPTAGGDDAELIEKPKPADIDARGLGRDAESGTRMKRHRQGEQTAHEVVRRLLQRRAVAMGVTAEGKATATTDLANRQRRRPGLSHYPGLSPDGRRGTWSASSRSGDDRTLLMIPICAAKGRSPASKGLRDE